MSATVIFYTDTGFVVAADGRSSAPAGESSEVEVETDSAQKIFQVSAKGYTLAYAISGPLIANKDRSFDIVSECRNGAELLSKRYPNDERLFEDALSRILKRYIGEAKGDGRIEAFPSMSGDPTSPELLTSIQMVGYIGHRAQWTEIKLRHVKQRVFIEKEMPILVPGQHRAHGSMVIPRLVEKSDPRFSSYAEAFRISPRDASIDAAANFAKAYISACSHPAAANADPMCRGIGGRLHMCTVTAEGFRWLIPPKDLT